MCEDLEQERPTKKDYQKKRTFKVLCIIHARIMGIYLLGRCVLVEADESVEEVVA